MTQRQFFSGFQKLLSFYLAIQGETSPTITRTHTLLSEQVAIFLFRYARQLKFYGVMVAQLAASVRLLEAFLVVAQKLPETPVKGLPLEEGEVWTRIATSVDTPVGIQDVIHATYTMLSALHTELGGGSGGGVRCC